MLALILQLTNSLMKATADKIMWDIRSLRELKSARTLLRDFNTAAKQQLKQQIEASDAAVQHLKSIRQDLDHAYSCIR